MAYQSAPDDLALHGVRVLGFPTTARLASRYQLDASAAGEALLDFEARGWVRQLSFAGSSGWSMTEAGQLENERPAGRRAGPGRGPGHESAPRTPRSGR